MTDTFQEDHELIRRYLAGRLDEAEELMIATRIVKDPQFRRETELTAALRQGFRELEKRGELATLLGPRNRRWRQPQFALAAGLGIVVLGGLLSLLLQQSPRGPLPAAATETLYFETRRGDETRADVVWRRTEGPVMLKMRFDVGLEPAAAYRVTVRRKDLTADETVEVLRADPASGEVELSVDGSLLEPGDYEIRLEPEPADASARVLTFTLLVTGT
jgi:hypothetical protein